MLGIFIDLSKAFDTADSTTPFKKLELHGITRNISNGFKATHQIENNL